MLPLAGVRVLSVEQYGAGPWGTQYLADLGAEVIKVENPNDGGDFARNIGPYFFTPEHSEFFHAYNRNKKSLTLDLSKKEGMAVFHDMVKTANAVATNLRGDVPDKLGLTYAMLGNFNREIVCAHLSAYGRTGPRSNWPGFDYLMQAETGYFSLTGEPGSPPTRFGLSVVDQMTGLALAYAVLAGITGARASGRGRDLDVSLFDVALCNLGYSAMWFLNEGHVTRREKRSGHPSLTPCALYTTVDGWIFIMAQTEKFWFALCDIVDQPEWKDDPRFQGYEGRHENRDELTLMLDRVLIKNSTAHWLDAFAGQVPSGPVNDLSTALNNPYFRDRGGVQSVNHPDRPDLKLLNNPIRLGELIPDRPGPKLGADTKDILGELGYSSADIIELRKNNAI